MAEDKDGQQFVIMHLAQEIVDGGNSMIANRVPPCNTRLYNSYFQCTSIAQNSNSNTAFHLALQIGAQAYPWTEKEIIAKYLAGIAKIAMVMVLCDRFC